jgi:hypothetical protein
MEQKWGGLITTAPVCFTPVGCPRIASSPGGNLLSDIPAQY